MVDDSRHQLLVLLLRVLPVKNAVLLGSQARASEAIFAGETIRAVREIARQSANNTHAEEVVSAIGLGAVKYQLADTTHGEIHGMLLLRAGRKSPTVPTVLTVLTAVTLVAPRAIHKLIT